jgi:hypothetical protein
VSPSSSPAPSAGPTQICEVQPNGFFGTDPAEEQDELEFFYDVEVAPGVTADTLNDEILSKLEVAIANSLLPGLFSETCTRRRATVRRNLQVNLAGISTKPPDTVLEGGELSFKRNGVILELVLP